MQVESLRSWRLRGETKFTQVETNALWLHNLMNYGQLGSMAGWLSNDVAFHYCFTAFCNIWSIAHEHNKIQSKGYCPLDWIHSYQVTAIKMVNKRSCPLDVLNQISAWTTHNHLWSEAIQYWSLTADTNIWKVGRILYPSSSLRLRLNCQLPTSAKRM